MTNKEYGIDKLAANKLTQRMNVLFPATGIGICVGVTVEYYLLSGGHPFSDATLFILLPFILLATVFAWRSFVRSSRHYFDTYKLTLTDNAIVLEVSGGPERGIEFGKTASITEDRDGTITAVSRSGKTALKIHKYVEHRDEVIAALNGIRPITPAPKKAVSGFMRTLAALAFLVCGLVATFSKDTTVIAAAGYITGSLIAAGCLFLLLSKTTERRTKMLAAVALGLLVAGLAAVYVLRLS